MLTLLQLLNACAPNVGARTMAAIVHVESGGNAFLIRDNDLNRSFAAVDANEAVAWSNQLLHLGHSIDLGMAQINSHNLARLGMSVREVFDPCANLRAGATILTYDYLLASREFGPGQLALRRALGAYNTGSIFGGSEYVTKILDAAGVSDAGFSVPDVKGARAQPPTAAAAAAPALISPYAAPILVPFAAARSMSTSSNAPVVLQVSHGAPPSASPTGLPQATPQPTPGATHTP